MKTILVPQFDDDLAVIGYKEVKIKNKPNSKDYMKVLKHLPGTPQGYGGSFYSISKKKPIDVSCFYDARQAGIGALRGVKIIVKPE